MTMKNSNAAKTTITRDVSKLDKETGNVYETVAMLGKRANQISVAIKEELSAKLEEFAVSGAGESPGGPLPFVAVFLLAFNRFAVGEISNSVITINRQIAEDRGVDRVDPVGCGCRYSGDQDQEGQSKEGKRLGRGGFHRVGLSVSFFVLGRANGRGLAYHPSAYGRAGLADWSAGGPARRRSVGKMSSAEITVTPSLTPRLSLATTPPQASSGSRPAARRQSAN